MMLDKFFIAVEITGKVLDKWLEGKGGGVLKDDLPKCFLVIITTLLY